MKNTPSKNLLNQKELINSVQYELFGRFVTNDDNKVSNTVEVWESIPKYFFTPRQVAKLRTATGHADPYKWEFMRDQVPCMVKIHPALIEQEDGTYKAFFPSVTEEFIEESLKKILADQQYGLHNEKELETWVRFTLRMIQKELKNKGRSRSINEIKHAIELMSSCLLIYYENGKEMWRGNILQDLVTIGRKEYLADSDAHHVARMPLFISLGISKMQFRQFNYPRFMGCKGQLSRWIFKKLIHRYRQASLINSYHFMYTGLKDSGLLQQSKEDKNRVKAEQALDELVKKGVLIRWKKDERKEGRCIIDVKYTVYPSSDFVAEQKAANKRKSDQHTQVLEAGVTLVDN